VVAEEGVLPVTEEEGEEEGLMDERGYRERAEVN